MMHHGVCQVKYIVLRISRKCIAQLRLSALVRDCGVLRRWLDASRGSRRLVLHFIPSSAVLGTMCTFLRFQVLKGAVGFSYSDAATAIAMAGERGRPPDEGIPSRSVSIGGDRMRFVTRQQSRSIGSLNSFRSFAERLNRAKVLVSTSVERR